MSTNVSEKRPPEQKPEGSRAFDSGSKGGRFGDQLFSGLSLAAGILQNAIRRSDSVKNTFSHTICAFAATSKATIGFADRHKK